MKSCNPYSCAFSDGKRGRAGYSVRQQDDRGSSSSLQQSETGVDQNEKILACTTIHYSCRESTGIVAETKNRKEREREHQQDGEESSGALMIRRVDYCCTVRLLSSSLLLASLRDCFLLIGAMSLENCVRRIFLPPFFLRFTASFKAKYFRIDQRICTLNKTIRKVRRSSFFLRLQEGINTAWSIFDSVPTNAKKEILFFFFYSCSNMNGRRYGDAIRVSTFYTVCI